MNAPASAPELPPAPPPPPEEKPGGEPPLEEETEFEEQPLAMFPSGHGWTGVNGAFADAGGPFIVNGDRSF